MARAPRTRVVDGDNVGVYHCVQRCVRRAFLCGNDAASGKSFEHRRQWIQDRIQFLAGLFGIDILAFAVMSNHLHLVLRNRPDAVAQWSDTEVARRWWWLFPQRKNADGTPEPPRKMDIGMVLADDQKVAELRRRLSSVSWFMKCLTERIAKQANAEDECTGRFWEGRFKCQPLLDESAVAACMAYVDLNPIRAGIAQTPETSEFTSAYERLQAARQASEESPSAVATEQAATSLLSGDIVTRAFEDRASAESVPVVALPETPKSPATQPRDLWLAPIEVARTHAAERALGQPQQRASHRGALPMTQAEYFQLLDWTGRQLRKDKRGLIPWELAPILERLQMTSDSWLRLVKSFRRLFRQCVGRTTSLQAEASRRGQHWVQGLSQSHDLFQSTAP